LQTQHPDPADRVKHLLGSGDADEALRCTIESYGPEMLGFLIAVLRDADAADDVFSVFCEDVWKGLAGFRGEASLRTWLYIVCRRALVRYRRSAYQRNRRGLSELGPLSRIAAEVRTLTRDRLQASAPTELERLRDQLSEDERALLILRVDRRLSWNEIAVAMEDSGEALDELTLRRQTAALRKRFERIKERLRALAEQSGLISDP
jgi:RNA polymerase sigma-70 factor (ECF subfamily)